MAVASGPWRLVLLLMVAACLPIESLGLHRTRPFARRWARRRTADLQPSTARQPLLKFAETAVPAAALVNAEEGSQALARRLAACSSSPTLACLREQHAGVQGNKFNYPHFFLIGWQKSATTSLHAYLESHPQTLGSFYKEPHYFLEHCDGLRLSCPPSPQQERYIKEILKLDQALESGMQLAAFESSAGYAKYGGDACGTHIPGCRVAAMLRQELPWLKIVASLREPIGHAMSLMNHHLQTFQEESHLVRGLAPGMPCLLHADAHTCLKHYFTDETANKGYASALSSWLEAFPASQLYIVQYENLTNPDTQPLVLSDLTHFLGLDPHHAKQEGHAEETLGSENVRGRGRPIEPAQYEEIVDLVRPDAERAAELLAKAGLGGGALWMKAWEAKWRATLEACWEGLECQV